MVTNQVKAGVSKMMELLSLTFGGANTHSGNNSFTGVNTFANPLRTSSDVGAVAAATVTAVEYGDGITHKTVLTLTNHPLAITDALAYGSALLYTFPAGRILIKGVVGALTMKVTSAANTLNDAAVVSTALGSAAASNITLATTMLNLAAAANCTAGVNPAASAAVNQVLAASTQLDGTATAIPVYLNAAVTTNTEIDADATTTWSGTITISWENLGDL